MATPRFLEQVRSQMETSNYCVTGTDVFTTEKCQGFCKALNKQVPDYVGGMAMISASRCCCKPQSKGVKKVRFQGTKEEDLMMSCHRSCLNEPAKDSNMDPSGYPYAGFSDDNYVFTCDCPNKIPPEFKGAIADVKKEFTKDDGRVPIAPDQIVVVSEEEKNDYNGVPIWVWFLLLGTGVIVITVVIVAIVYALSKN